MKHEFIDKFNEPLSHLSGNPIMIVRPRWKQSVATLCCLLRLLRDWNCNERLPGKSPDIYTVVCESRMEFTIRYSVRSNGLHGKQLEFELESFSVYLWFFSYAFMSFMQAAIETEVIFTFHVQNTFLYQYTTGYHNNNNRCRSTIIREGENRLRIRN